MKTTVRLFTLAAAMLVAISAANAQAGRRALRAGARPDSVRREAARQRLANLTPEQRAGLQARREMARQRFASLTPQQKIRLQARRQLLRTERQTLASRVKSGQVTRAQARAEFRAWQKAQRAQRAQRPRVPRGIR